MRSAQVCATLANINRDPKKQPYEIADFMLRFKPPERRDQPKEAGPKQEGARIAPETIQWLFAAAHATKMKEAKRNA